jgi:hypothetical protein
VTENPMPLWKQLALIFTVPFWAPFTLIPRRTPR